MCRNPVPDSTCRHYSSWSSFATFSSWVTSRRDLPEVFGPWQTVWNWHHRMATEGTWVAVLAALTAAADEAGLVDWSLSVDSTDRSCASARDEHEAPDRGLDRITRIPDVEPPDHAVGRSRGGLSTTIHQLVDGNGLPLVALLTAGQAGDSPMFLPLMGHLPVARPVGRPRT